MVKKLFGGSSSSSGSTQSSQSGFPALPGFAQEDYEEIARLTRQVLGDPEQYFAPMDLTDQELQARGIIDNYLDPDTIRSGFETFMNPYRDIVFEDIDRMFEQGPLARFTADADEANAFGSSRFDRGLYDLGRAKADATRLASADQFNTAMGQYLGTRQQGLSNLLGFGSLERNIDLAQRMSLPQALGLGVDIYSPLLSSSTSTGTSFGTSNREGGIMPGLSSFFSDIRLKEDIRLIGEENGFNIYEFKYIGGDGRFRGVLAHEVEKINPAAVSEIGGFKAVDYNAIGVEMRRV